MSRDLTMAYIEELAKGAKTIVVFFEGEFLSGVTRFWSGIGEIEWNGETWVGTGGMGRISPIEETTDIRATGVNVQLVNINNEIVSIVLAEVKAGLPCKIWFGFLNDDGIIIADPAMAFVGRLDVPDVADFGSECNITLSYESRLRDLKRPRELRYTHESQQRLYPGDKGFEFVPSLQEWNGLWGRS